MSESDSDSVDKFSTVLDKGSATVSQAKSKASSYLRNTANAVGGSTSSAYIIKNMALPHVLKVGLVIVGTANYPPTSNTRSSYLGVIGRSRDFIIFY